MEDEKKTKKQLIEELNALRLEQIEQTRVTSEKVTKALLQNSIPTVISTLKEGRVFEASDAFLRMVGLKRDEVIGRTSIEIGYFTQEQRASLINELNKNGCIENLEMEIRARDGSLRYGLFNTVVVSINNENYLLTTIQDITARKQAEEALQKSERHIKLALEGTDQGLWEWNILHKKVVYDENWQRMMNLPLGGRYVDLDQWLASMDAGGRAEFEIKMTDYLAGRAKYYELVHRLQTESKDWKWIWTRGIATERDPSGIPLRMIGTYRDITKLKEQEESLRESENKLQAIFDTVGTGILIIDKDTQIIIEANTTAVAMIGLSKESVIGQICHSLVCPDQVGKCPIKDLGHTVDHSECKLLCAEGHQKDILKTVYPITIKGRNCYVESFTDITLHKQAEEEKRSLLERLNRAEKMEALGQMAGGVAHDLNNVLGILSGYSELLLIEIPKGQRARNYVETILQSTEKGAAIIQDLLTLARRGVTSSDVINLNNIVLDFLKTPVFENVKNYHPRVTFRVECQEALLNIKGSHVHLEKTLMNLVSNAAESISGMGEVVIRTENRYLDKAVMGYDEVKAGDYTILTISDTGMGIPDEHIEKIFEPFYTKKIMGRSGTGLGLAIVWGTVKDHNGYIDVQTKVGKGTIFTLYFPVTREELTTPQQKLPIEQYTGKGESILVVDDIAEQRDVATGLLSKLGYEVHAVSSGEEAVEYLKSGKADILVLDMIMPPGIDGLETYQRILEINPQQKAILVSGFSETNRVKKAQQLGAGAYVRKPYVMEKIGVAIRDELGRK